MINVVRFPNITFAITNNENYSVSSIHDLGTIEPVTCANAVHVSEYKMTFYCMNCFSVAQVLPMVHTHVQYEQVAKHSM